MMLLHLHTMYEYEYFYMLSPTTHKLLNYTTTSLSSLGSSWMTSQGNK